MPGGEVLRLAETTPLADTLSHAYIQKQLIVTHTFPERSQRNKIVSFYFIRYNYQNILFWLV